MQNEKDIIAVHINSEPKHSKESADVLHNSNASNNYCKGTNKVLIKAVPTVLKTMINVGAG